MNARFLKGGKHQKSDWETERNKEVLRLQMKERNFYYEYEDFSYELRSDRSNCD